ncbi:hypothetical protein SAMN00768000_2193 [Sulfobacillus thermosulfidooxidans DSM 9293]|uniref:Uncharacterized protein n=2 Tax=Sulfobacillus thermosulfidooxidans TaxID=28034 RepID=A0A1W1WHY9_SULTA|nr:hypothetical protein SAMN00768000_2193 [Sulfobacillus thermosulfidooxidans DSM 9293]
MAAVASSPNSLEVGAMGITPERRALLATWQRRPWRQLSLREAVGLPALEIAQNDPRGCTPDWVVSALHRRGDTLVLPMATLLMTADEWATLGPRVST